MMKIAVAWNKGEIEPNFADIKEYKVCEISTGLVASSSVEKVTGDPGEFLTENNISTVICGAIENEAKKALVKKYIHVYYDVTGDADEAVRKWLGSQLEIKPGF